MLTFEGSKVYFELSPLRVVVTFSNAETGETETSMIKVPPPQAALAMFSLFTKQISTMIKEKGWQLAQTRINSVELDHPEANPDDPDEVKFCDAIKAHLLKTFKAS